MKDVGLLFDYVVGAWYQAIVMQLLSPQELRLFSSHH